MGFPTDRPTTPDALANKTSANSLGPTIEYNKEMNQNGKDYNAGKIDAKEYNDRREAAVAKRDADIKANEQKSQADNASNNQSSTPSNEPTASPEDKKAAETQPAQTSNSSPAKKSTPAKKSKLGGSWDTKDTTLFQGDQGNQYKSNDISVPRQSLPFMFEVREPKDSPKGANAVWQILLPFNPEGYRMIYTPRASTTITQGGVFEDNIGITPPKFMINGVIGIVGTSLIGIGKSLEKEKKSGLELYHEIEQGLLSFYERFGTYRLDGREHTDNDRTRAEKDGKTLQYLPELRFFNFCDQEYWQVQINQFTLTRNTQRKHLYQYEIQMTGLKRLGKDQSPNEQDTVINMLDAGTVRNPEPAAKQVSAFDKFMNGMKSLTGKMSELKNKVGQLQSQMTAISTAVANFKNGLTDLVHAPFDLIKTALETTNSIIGSINAIGNLPHEFLNGMRETQRLLMSYSRQPQMFSTPTTSTSNVTKGVTEGTTTKTEILTKPINLTATTAASFTTMNIPEETIFISDNTTKPVAVRQAAITDTDTILTIAAKNGTDWKQVAALNELDYPFIVKDISETVSPIVGYGYLAQNAAATDNVIYIENIFPAAGQILMIGGKSIVEVDSVQFGQTTLTEMLGTAYMAGDMVTLHEQKLNVLKPGDLISIPGTTATSTPIANSQASFEEKLYGIDEMLDEAGFQPDYGTGDIVVAKGLDNIEMQLAHRIKTLRGELTELGHPEYGSLVPTFIGKMNTPVWQQRILIECQMTVLDDPRVDSLGNSTFVVDNTEIFFTSDVYLKGQGNPLQISLPIV